MRSIRMDALLHRCYRWCNGSCHPLREFDETPWRIYLRRLRFNSLVTGTLSSSEFDEAHFTEQPSFIVGGWVVDVDIEGICLSKQMQIK